MPGASVGVTTLYLNHIITADNYSFSWFTWWAGDSIGVLLFTPMILLVLSTKSGLTNIRKAMIILPAVVIFASVLLLFFWSTESRDRSITSEINETANRYFLKIAERLNISDSKLSGYNAFFHSSNNVSKEEFINFSIILIDNDKVFQAVGWVEIIEHKNRDYVERELSRQNNEKVNFKEVDVKGELNVAPVRDEYYSVLYIYPLEINKRAIGVNLASNENRFTALNMARRNKKPYATSPVVLAQDLERKYSYIIYLPVFRKHQKTKETFVGYVSGVFKVAGLFGDVVQSAKENNYGIIVTDITDSENIIPLFSSDGVKEKQFSSVLNVFDFGGRSIQAEFYLDTSSGLITKNWVSWTILTGGFMMVALLQSFILMITGVTESIRREVDRKTHDLNEAKKIAENANRSKSNFTANMSHEIRTPLHAVIGLINLCLKTSIDKQQKEYLDKARLASDTLLLLVNQVLDYSKIEAGKLELEVTRLDFPAVLRKLNSLFAMQFKQKGIDFSFKLPDKIPLALKGDPLRLEQILINLCGNALKFTENGSVVVDVSVQSISDTHVAFDFSVIDTGIGISVEQRAGLFKPYEQADNSMSRTYGGSGLGLTICKQIVDLMGGSISVSSQEGEGSRFDIHVILECNNDNVWVDSSRVLNEIHKDEEEPYVNDMKSSTQVEQLEHSSKNKMNNKLQLAGLNILLVEDVMVNQLIAKSILETHGAKIIVAENGLEALDQLHNNQDIDLILMDIQMPKMDGYEATRKIRQIPSLKNIPIIAMTANAMSNDIKQCIEAGMNDHLAKPFEEIDIISKICSYIVANKDSDS